MRFVLAVGLLLMAAPVWAETPRVRKELRSLSDDEYKAFVTGLAVMQAVPTDAGKILFGPNYRSYNEMLIKHAVAVNDPRGDQGHFSPCFMNFHRAFMLELEQSLLAISPSMKALPYWDITADNPDGGKYYNTSEYIFSDKYAGSIEGNPTVGYGVTSGIFGWRQVPKFVAAQWPQYSSIFNGSAAGYLRSSDNENEGIFVTRYPTSNLLNYIKDTSEATGTATLPFALYNVSVENQYIVDLKGEYTISYTQKNFERCLDPENYTNWVEWTFCIDYTALMFTPNPYSDDDIAKYLGEAANGTGLFHPGVHWGIGSIGANTSTMGDLFDVTTSPNDILFFITHHNNIDRSSTIWQHNAVKMNASVVSDYWGYPVSNETFALVDGCFLNDVINANAPFAEIFDTPPENSTGYTHQELLKYTSPGVSPYTFDTMVDSASSTSASAPAASSFGTMSAATWPAAATVISVFLFMI